MTDKELLELAAKAAGMNEHEYNNGKTNAYYANSLFYMTPKGKHFPWNPLNDDGDALRLAVKLMLDFDTDIDVVRKCLAKSKLHAATCLEDGTKDPYAATRRAIVRAAAAIGKEMK